MTPITLWVSVSALTGNGAGCMLWERSKTFEKLNEAVSYLTRMGQIYGLDFQYWARS